MINYNEKRPFDYGNRELLRKDMINFSFIIVEKSKEEGGDEETLDVILNDVFRAHTLLSDFVYEEMSKHSELEIIDYVTNVYSLYMTGFYDEKMLSGDRYWNYVEKMQEDEFVIQD